MDSYGMMIVAIHAKLYTGIMRVACMDQPQKG